MSEFYLVMLVNLSPNALVSLIPAGLKPNKMRICVDLILFLYVSSVCGFSNRQVMDRLGYIEDRINAESKFRRDDFGILFSEIGAIKTMLQKSQENKSESKELDTIEATGQNGPEIAEKVKILSNGFKEEKTLNARFRREIPELHKHVKDLKIKTDQISASLENILNGIDFLKDQNEKRQETYNLIDNRLPEIQTNILDLQEQFEQTHTAESESLDKIRTDTDEMKKEIKHTQEMCLESIRTSSNLTENLQEKIVNGEMYCKAGKYPITTEKDEQQCNCTVFSCPEISTPSTERPTTSPSTERPTTSPSTERPTTSHQSSTSPPNNLNTTYKSCLDLYNNGFKSSVVYEIEIEHERRLPVYCDMTTDGGGWTVFQRRQDGSVDFFRDWNDYKNGFGNLTGEFWLGNEYLHLLTDNDEPHELRIELEDHDGNRAYAKYGSFKVRSEGMNYKLHVRGYSGDAGDSLFKSAPFGPHDDMEFTTKDKDNDNVTLVNCASRWQGGWWFNKCFHSHLNGLYHDHSDCEQKWNCIIWDTWKGSDYSMKFTEMKFR